MPQSRKRNSSFTLVLCVVLAAIQGNAASATGEVGDDFLYGWELLQHLEGRVGKDVDSLLSAKWTDSYVVKGQGEKATYNVQSCTDYFNIAEKAAKPTSGLDFPPYTFMCLQCIATLRASKAKRGDDTYLKNVRLDQSLLSLLPSEIEFGQDVPKGKPWSEVSGAVFVGAKKRYLEFKGTSFGYYLYPIAYGDFDSDGRTDLMIILKSFALDGNYVLNSGFVLTRDKNDGLLRVVEEIPVFLERGVGRKN